MKKIMLLCIIYGLLGSCATTPANEQITYHDGSIYIGQVKTGNAHGDGTLTHPNGAKYVGQFKNNLPNGQGTFTWSDLGLYGGEYIGQWKDGKKHGQGTMTSERVYGGKYVGQWKDDLPNGQGTWTGLYGEYVGRGISWVWN